MQDDLIRLLDVSRRNNIAHHVTGALAYDDGSFIQVIEGPGPAIDDLLRRIAHDLRNPDDRLSEAADIRACVRSLVDGVGAGVAS